MTNVCYIIYKIVNVLSLIEIIIFFIPIGIYMLILGLYEGHKGIKRNKEEENEYVYKIFNDYYSVFIFNRLNKWMLRNW